MINRINTLRKTLCLLISVVLVCLFIASCDTSSSDPTISDKDDSETTSTTSAPIESETTASSSPSPTLFELILLPPVETNDPHSDYQPAFDQQTRAPGTQTQSDYSVTILTEDLLSPWAISVLPDGRFIITEKNGTLRIMTTDGILSEPIGGFPSVDDRNQGGLLDVALAPDFASSRMLFFTLAELTDEGSLTAVGRGRLSDDEQHIEDFSIIWRALPYFDNSAHFGSRLIFDSNGNLFVTTGDRSSIATRSNAQTLDNGYGKVIHITPEGDPVPGNPFIDHPDALPEIYSYGHRNLQGLDIHPETGEIFVSEHGPRGGDELNLIIPGGNYGWPVISYGTEYSGDSVADGLTAMDGMEQPLYYWDPALAPSGITFYTSDLIAEWKGNLFIGGLAGQHIARLVIDNGRVIAEERLLEDEGQRFRDICEGPDGALYAVTDAGRVYRIG